MYPCAEVNPLGDWTGGTNVDTGATNRKLGSDMGDSITGGGLHGKDLSKADVSVNIYAWMKAQVTGETVEVSCATGDDEVNGIPYQALSSEVASKYGYNVHACIFDELLGQSNRKLYETMTQGSGAARKQPLNFVITTAGSDRTTICYEVHQKAIDLLEGGKKTRRSIPSCTALPAPLTGRIRRFGRKPTPPWAGRWTFSAEGGKKCPDHRSAPAAFPDARISVKQACTAKNIEKNGLRTLCAAMPPHVGMTPGGARQESCISSATRCA